MTDEAPTTMLNETRGALELLQNFNLDRLDRSEEFGTAVSFAEAIEPAKHLINLYLQLKVDVLEDIPDGHLADIKRQADHDYSLFSEILDFDINVNGAGAPANRATAISNKIKNAYNGAFSKLHAWIAYSSHRLTDFDDLERRARSAEQAINTRTSQLMTKLAETEKQAAAMLEEVRKTAAEQGVSQQAIHFSEEAKLHTIGAQKWQTRVYWFAGGLGVYVVASLFFHTISWLAPSGKHADYQMFQLAVSKVLGFGLLSFLLGLAAKNYQSHRHNAVLNKHRLNALKTFTALADAASNRSARDIILSHAAHCIFGPQPTGYGKSVTAEPPTMKALVEMVSKAGADK